ncbi:MAG: hypothetical protein WA045_06205, partial [Nitrospira sp.]
MGEPRFEEIIFRFQQSHDHRRTQGGHPRINSMVCEVEARDKTLDGRLWRYDQSTNLLIVRGQIQGLQVGTTLTPLP